MTAWHITFKESGGVRKRRKARSFFTCSKASGAEKAGKQTGPAGVCGGEPRASDTITLCRGGRRVLPAPERACRGAETGKDKSKARGVAGTTRDAEPERRDGVLAAESTGHPWVWGTGLTAAFTSNLLACGLWDAAAVLFTLPRTQATPFI